MNQELKFNEGEEMQKITIVGNVGADPKTGSTQSGKLWASFSVAPLMSKSEKEKTDQAWWVVACFDKTAEIAQKYVKKGMRLTVCGTISFEKYTDNEGVQREIKKIIYPEIVLPQLSQDSEKREYKLENNYQEKSARSENFNDEIPF